MTGEFMGAGPAGAEAAPLYSAYAATVCAGAAAWLMTGRNDGVRRARLLMAGSGEAAGPRGAWEEPRWWRELRAEVRGRLGGRAGREWWCLPGGVALAVWGASWIPLVAGLAAVPWVRRWLLRQKAVRVARARESAVVELCAAVAGELRAGCQPDRALLAVERADGAVVRGLGDAAAAVLAAARFGGDVPEALREAGRLPGAEGLVGVAACWQVAVEGGAGLAEGLDRVAGALRAELDQREELRAQLAGPRSTALALALLPVVGLALGSAMDADPLKVLLHSPAGLLCLAAGLGLEAAGAAWVTRIMRTAEGSERSVAA